MSGVAVIFLLIDIARRLVAADDRKKHK